MSSALKPVLPPTGTQSSSNNPQSSPGRSLGGPQGMAQHASAPGPYSTGPLGHVPQNLSGLSHPHGGMGLPGSNMSMNTVSNMSQMGGHVGMNQPPSLNMQSAHNNPIKTPALPPTSAIPAVATATAGNAHVRPVPHAYLSGGSAPSGPPQEEGTTLPPSQNSAQLMAMHRAQQQQHNQNQQQHHSDSQPPLQPAPDRYKAQINQPQQAHQQPPQPPQTQQPPPISQQQLQNHPNVPVQSNGTVSGTSDTTISKITVPTPPTVEAKIESLPSPVPAVQNHVTPSNENDVNSKVENLTTSVGNASVPTQNQTPTNSEPKPAVAATPVAEPATEVPQQAVAVPVKPPVVPKEIVAKPPSTMKLATTPRTTSRKRETKKISESPKSTSSSSKTPDGKSPGAQNNRPPDKAKTPRTPSEERKSKRTRTRTQPYQSPIPELALITKLSSSTASHSKGQDDKLIVFYKNEFLAVRNAEGGFYVCQAVQNVYKSSLRIRIRWLSQDKDKIYIPDFYDSTDFDCILTNLNMERVEKGKYNLPKDELERTENILKRALAVESGEATPSLTEEHPDGLDVSLYRDESQLKKKRKSKKRKASRALSAKRSSSNNKSKKTPDKSKVRKISKSPAPKAAVKKNNQSPDRKYSSSSTPNSSINMDKRESSSRVSRKSDGGRAERAKRREETSTPIVVKTSPVVDQKKARVLAKVAMKTAISSSSAQNKKKGKNIPSVSVKAVPVAATKPGVKTTRSAAASSAPAVSASTSSTRRGKKNKK